MSGLDLQLRPPYPRPQYGNFCASDNLGYGINFRHPGYSDSNNILFILPGLDHNEGGIHFATALDACGIVAGNRWDGFFKETRGGTRLEVPRDTVLRGRDYYFYVPDIGTAIFDVNLPR